MKTLREKIETKQELQEWLTDSDFNWTHFVTIEPTPSLYMKRDELVQRLRMICYTLDKHFVQGKISNKKLSERFYFIGFEEGKKGLGNTHYHLVLNTPKSIVKNKDDCTEEFISKMMVDNWFNIESINPRTGENRIIKDKSFYVKPITDTVEGVTIYCSKKYDIIGDNDNMFIVN